MQSIDLICVGKLNADYYAAGVADYQKRLGAFCNFRIVELPEEKIQDKNASQSTIDKALEIEGKNILSHVKKGAAIVALCVEGKQLSSEELSEYIQQRALSGSGDMAFIIGSSHGLSPAVKQAAAFRLGMSKMTLPHQLARLVLTEQLYRAFSIAKGTKYHK